MKIRSGFVSNSSSSSFICSIPKNINKLKLTLEVDLKSSSMIDAVLSTNQEVVGYAEYEDLNKKTLNKLLKEIEDGKKILAMRPSSEDFDEPASVVLYNEQGNESKLFKEDSNVKIIKAEWSWNLAEKEIFDE